MGIFSWWKRHREGGRTLEELQRILDPENDFRLERWISGRPDMHTYEEFSIPKHSGGFRTIHAPSMALKELQRRVYKRLLKKLPVSRFATAYVPGRSIVDNARPHTGRTVVVTLDLRDFFPSTTEDRVREMWRRLGWGTKACDVLTRICCHKGGLPQGAPTSPALSNAVNYQMDERIASVVQRRGGAYTRYSDDITLSFDNFGPAERGAIREVRAILAEYGYSVHEGRKKMHVARPHHRQLVTGLVVNEKVNVPRALRRKIRAMQHQASQGRLSPRDSTRLRGYEAFLAMVERARNE